MNRIRKTQKLFFLLSLFASLSCPFIVHAEIIRLKNGNAIETKILRENDEFVTVEAQGGKVKIPKSDIETIWRGSQAELLEVSNKQIYFAKGVELYKEGQFLEAAESFQQALGAATANAIIYANIASAYASAGEASQAEANFLKALAQAPENADVLLNLAHFYESQKKFKKAIPYYKQVLEIEHDDQKIIQNLAFCYYMTDDFEKSLKLYESLKRMNDIPFLNNRAAVLIKLDRMDEALAILSSLTKGRTDLKYPFLNLAEIYRLKGDYLASEKQYEIVLSKNPHDIDATIGLGHLHLAKKDFSKAEHFFREALKLQPENTVAQYGLAQVLINSEELSEIEGLYEKILENDPNNIAVLNNFGILYLKKNEPQKALEIFQTLVIKDKKYARGYANAGLAYAFLGDADNALKEWNRALELDPKLEAAAQNKKILEDAIQGINNEETI